MNKEIRVAWEPQNLTPIEEIASRVMDYTEGKGGVSLLNNGTLLFIKSADSDQENARLAIEEAKYLTDFEVQEMKDGNFLVVFHNALAVFVGSKEFEATRLQIINRIDELKFPSEELLSDPNNTPDNMLVGLYGRGKLQGDVYNFKFYKRL